MRDKLLILVIVTLLLFVFPVLAANPCQSKITEMNGIFKPSPTVKYAHIPVNGKQNPLVEILSSNRKMLKTKGAATTRFWPHGMLEFYDAIIPRKNGEVELFRAYGKRCVSMGFVSGKVSAIPYANQIYISKGGTFRRKQRSYEVAIYPAKKAIYLQFLQSSKMFRVYLNKEDVIIASSISEKTFQNIASKGFNGLSQYEDYYHLSCQRKRYYSLTKYRYKKEPMWWYMKNGDWFQIKGECAITKQNPTSLKYNPLKTKSSASKRKYDAARKNLKKFDINVWPGKSATAIGFFPMNSKKRLAKLNVYWVTKKGIEIDGVKMARHYTPRSGGDKVVHTMYYYLLKNGDRWVHHPKYGKFSRVEAYITNRAKPILDKIWFSTKRYANYAKDDGDVYVAWMTESPAPPERPYRFYKKSMFLLLDGAVKVFPFMTTSTKNECNRLTKTSTSGSAPGRAACYFLSTGNTLSHQLVFPTPKTTAAPVNKFYIYPWANKHYIINYRPLSSGAPWIIPGGRTMLPKVDLTKWVTQNRPTQFSVLYSKHDMSKQNVYFRKGTQYRTDVIAIEGGTKLEATKQTAMGIQKVNPGSLGVTFTTLKYDKPRNKIVHYYCANGRCVIDGTYVTRSANAGAGCKNDAACGAGKLCTGGLCTNAMAMCKRYGTTTGNFDLHIYGIDMSEVELKAYLDKVVPYMFRTKPFNNHKAKFDIKYKAISTKHIPSLYQKVKAGTSVSTLISYIPGSEKCGSADLIGIVTPLSFRSYAMKGSGFIMGASYDPPKQHLVFVHELAHALGGKVGSRQVDIADEYWEKVRDYLKKAGQVGVNCYTSVSLADREWRALGYRGLASRAKRAGWQGCGGACSNKNFPTLNKDTRCSLYIKPSADSIMNGPKITSTKFNGVTEKALDNKLKSY